MSNVLQIVGPAFGLPTSQRTLPSNATIAKGDLVTSSSGQLEVAVAGNTLIGVLLDENGVTSADTGTFNDSPFLRVLLDNDNVGTTFAATHIYARFDITGADGTASTGDQVVDTSTVDGTLDGTETGQVLCLEYNPQGFGFDTDTSVGTFVLTQNPYDAIA